MSHNKHTTSKSHKELEEFGEKWFEDQTKDWIDPYGTPIVTVHDGVNVVRDDLIVGSKARFADLLVSEIPNDTIVYVQPRVGLAGVSIIDVANKYGKKVVLFMPSSKK